MLISKMASKIRRDKSLKGAIKFSGISESGNRIYVSSNLLEAAKLANKFEGKIIYIEGSYKTII